jgi:hypothetical protein
MTPEERSERIRIFDEAAKRLRDAFIEALDRAMNVK